MTENRSGPATPATIVDVARLAGVSKTTASDALRGRGRISPATKEAVAAAAGRLGYSINRSARSLRTATTGAIGVYVPQMLVRSEHYMSFVLGVVNEAARVDQDVTLIVSGQASRPGYAPHVDGLVLIDPVDDDPMLHALMATRLPIVSSERFPSGRQPTGVVWSDHGHYTRLLLDHLADRGARRPALVASTTISEWSLTIQDAYRGWCARAGIEPLITVAPFGADPALLRESVDALLTRAPETDALVCAGDGVAAAVSPALIARGLQIGIDFLLASCVDSSAVQALHPRVTAIDAKGGEAGAACARLLFGILDGTTPAGTTIELPLELHLRQSTLGTTG